MAKLSLLNDHGLFEADPGRVSLILADGRERNLERLLDAWQGSAWTYGEVKNAFSEVEVAIMVADAYQHLHNYAP